MITNVMIRNLNHKLSTSVTHHTFDYFFDEDIEGFIPNLTTHLTFGRNFNQDIRECIPKSVTYLSFGY